MPPNVKASFFGMTPAQAAVLAVLAVVSFVVLGVGLFVSLTDRAPAPPAQPTPTPIPGWKALEGEGVTLWLPVSFTGGDPETDLELIVGSVRALGPEYLQLAQMIEQNQTAFVIWAFDAQVGPSGFLTNVNVTREKAPSATTVSAYMEAVVKQLPSDFRVVGREVVALDRYQAGQLTLEFTVLGRAGKQLSYMIKDGRTMWTVTYSTGADEFERRQPIFEQSAHTFVIQP